VATTADTAGKVSTEQDIGFYCRTLVVTVSGMLETTGE
jgi:hypothetical protein